VGPPLSRLCSTIRARGGLSAQWWVDRKKAVPVARAARRLAGARADLSNATTAVRRSAASLGATLTPGDIAIERRGCSGKAAAAASQPGELPWRRRALLSACPAV